MAKTITENTEPIIPVIPIIPAKNKEIINMKNHFKNAPTVGSHDFSQPAEDMDARVSRLESRFNEAGSTHEDNSAEKGRKKWRRAKKFFRSIIRPVLEFIPKVITAVSFFLNAFAKFRGFSPA